MKKKKIIAMLIMIAMLASMLAGCGSSTSSSEAAGKADSGSASGETEAAQPSGKTRPETGNKESNSLTLSVVDVANTLDPLNYSLQSESTIVMQIYEPLFITANDGSLEYILIEDMTVAEDDSQASFTLKDGIKFHSGDVLTAEDVAYTLSRCANSPTLSTISPYIEIEVIDDTHFNMNFPYAEAGAGYSAVASYMDLFTICNKSFCEQYVTDPSDDTGFNCDGTGAYKFDSMDSAGNVVLKRFEDYHGEASIDTLNFLVVTGDQELAFEAGDIDYAMYSGSTYKLIKEYENVYAYEQGINNTMFMVCNAVEGAVTSDIRVREAIAHLINREDVTIVATDDSGEAAYNMANPTVEYYADCCTHYELDVDTANSLMAQAGYSESNKAPVALICISAYPLWVSACEIIKENLEQSYFTVSIEEVADTSRYFTQDFDLAFIAIGLTSSFLSYSMLYDSSSGMNLGGVPDEQAAAVMEYFNDMSSEENVHAAMNAVVEDLVYQPMSYTASFLAFDGNLNVGSFYVGAGLMLYRQFSWK